MYTIVIVDTKVCPYCAEEIKVAAIVCKHCGRELPEFEDQYAREIEETSSSKESRRVKGINWGFGAVTGIFFSIIYIGSRLSELIVASQINAIVFRQVLFDLFIQAIIIFIIFNLLGAFANWLWTTDWRIVVGVFTIIIALLIWDFDSKGGLSSNELLPTVPNENIQKAIPTKTSQIPQLSGNFNMECDPVSKEVMTNLYSGERFCVSGILVDTPFCSLWQPTVNGDVGCRITISWQGYSPPLVISAQEKCLGCEFCEKLFDNNCKYISSLILYAGDCVNLRGYAWILENEKNGEIITNSERGLVIDKLGSMTTCSIN